MCLPRLLSKVLEFNKDGGIIVDDSRRHNFMTVVKWEEIRHQDREWMKTLSETHQVLVLPARLHGDLEIVKGALVEVQEQSWTPAEITSEAFQNRVWVRIERGQKEVEVSKLRSRFDRVAIFGDRGKRTIVQLIIMKALWKLSPGCDFGLHSQLALGHDEDWGTYRRYCRDQTFVDKYSNYVEKVLQLASGCAVNFVGLMFFATGSTKARSSAAAMIRDLEKAHQNVGELPAGQEDGRFSQRIKSNRASIDDLLNRKQGHCLPVEEDLQVLILLSRGKEAISNVSELEEGALLEVFYSGKWHEAQKTDDDEESGKIKVSWPDGTTSRHAKEEVRSAASEVVCYSHSAWRRGCAALHFLARSGENSQDGGLKASQEVRKLLFRGGGHLETVEPAPGGATLCQKVSKRIARAARCGLEVIGGNLVLFGDTEAFESAKLLLAWAIDQKGNALAPLIPQHLGHFVAVAALTRAE